MRRLRVIACLCGMVCATGASANEVFEFSFRHDKEPVPENTVFVGSHGVRFQHRLGRRVTVEFNFSASSRLSEAQQNLAAAIRPRNLIQPLKIGRTTLSLGAKMGVRFGLKF